MPLDELKNDEMPTASLDGADDEGAERVIPEAPRPELGDVADALDDAAASLKAVVSDTSERLVDDLRAIVRENPLLTLAAVGGLAYLVGRMRR